MLQGISDFIALSEIEEEELSQPIARKVLGDRTIYNSRPMPVNTGLPVLCDFGEARIGHKHTGDVMPGIYRAPEVILGMEWDSKVDIWSIGLTAPLEFIRRSDMCFQYWDEYGNWKGSIPIPEQSFEIRERSLQGDVRTMFLHFLRMTLAWLPEERLLAEDLARHAFLMQPLLAANGAEQYS